MNLIFVFNLLKRLRVAFSCLWSGEHVFVHVFRRVKGGLREGFKG